MRIKWLLERSKPESKKCSENNNESTAELFRKVVGVAYTILFYSSNGCKVIIEKRKKKNSKICWRKYFSILKNN